MFITKFTLHLLCAALLRIRIRSVSMFLGLQDPDPELFVRIQILPLISKKLR
jgi:hypothetical protein